MKKRKKKKGKRKIVQTRCIKQHKKLYLSFVYLAQVLFSSTPSASSGSFVCLQQASVHVPLTRGICHKLQP